MKVDESFLIFCTYSLGDPEQDRGRYVPESQDKQKTKLDLYEYAMHGKIYEVKHDDVKQLTFVYASFGGLLMKITGDKEQLLKFKDDERMYILIRKS